MSTPNQLDPADAVRVAALDRLATAAAVTARPLGSTYRLQMHAGFNLSAALAILDYLHSLGITHVYTSSLVTAKPGSTHGYDVVDPDRLNPELGTEAEFAAFAAALRDRGMGLLLDVVPNHMSVVGPNAWWHDVLEHGRASRFAEYFDIAWDDHPREQLRGKVLLPILGDRYGAAIDGGVFKVEYAGGGFGLRVYENLLPIDPATYELVLAPLAPADITTEDEHQLELRRIVNAVRNLPPRDDPARATDRWVETVAIKRRLAALTDAHPPTAEAVAARVAAVNASAEELGGLIDAQAYRPCYWRVASDEINYRRFFDVNELGALATEREEVFAAVHRRVFAWLADGWVDGLRIDHVDGLYDPKTYLDRLQTGYLLARAEALLASRPDAYPELHWADVKGELAERFARPDPRPLTVVVEKILAPRETVPTNWATDGTSGYEFAVAVGGLLVDPAGERPLTEAYVRMGGLADPFAEVAYRCKFLVLQATLTSELHVLARHLDVVAQAGRWSRDFTLNGLRHALRVVLACFPAYRSYITDTVTDTDRLMVNRAIRVAHRRNPSLGRELFEFIRDTLLLNDPPDGSGSDEYRAAQQRFAGKFQQLSAPVTAKGIEDTAFYRYTRLAALCEVGGHPGRFGTPPAEVHAFLATRPVGSLSPLSTHDTKRSEDVRARLAVLSELAVDYANHAGNWSELNHRHKVELDDGVFAPDGNEEWLIYQTLLGAWPHDGCSPDFVARVQAYMVKALHEAKVNSSWVNPDAAYDDGVCRFVARILDQAESGEFLAAFEPFQQTVSRYGMTNSLSQTLVRCTAPGVPDTYQGTELWDYSLVDPDNRRPVDYAVRREVLAALDAAPDRLALARDLVANPVDGRIKLYVTSRALRLRRERGELFSAGGYHPVPVQGEKAECLFVYLRRNPADAVLVAVPRLVTRLGPPDGPADWGDTAIELPDDVSQTWTDLFTGLTLQTVDGRLTAADLFAAFPVACLVPAGG